VRFRLYLQVSGSSLESSLLILWQNFCNHYCHNALVFFVAGMLYYLIMYLVCDPNLFLLLPLEIHTKNDASA
jgi:hypothetical protein